MARPLRIGQIVPSSNTTMETEIPAMLRARENIRPERFTCHSSRMRMQKVTKEELESMNREGVRCAAELADARVDVMSTACLVAIMAIGLGYHRKMEEELTAAARANHLLAPVMTSAGALIEGLKTLGARRISLMAPYMRPLTDLVVKYIEHEGIEVVDSICFEIPDNLEGRPSRPAATGRGRAPVEYGWRRCRGRVCVRSDAVAAGGPADRGQTRHSHGIDRDMHHAVDTRSTGSRTRRARSRRAALAPQACGQAVRMICEVLITKFPRGVRLCRTNQILHLTNGSCCWKV